MIGYLIDPTIRTVHKVDYNGDYKQIYDLLSDDNHRVEMFQVVEINEHGDGVFVDEEGLLNGNPHGWFTVRGYPGVLRGKGLVLGVDEEGDSVTPKAPLITVFNMVEFLTTTEVKLRVAAGTIR
jgi:hypothetical protein